MHNNITVATSRCRDIGGNNCIGSNYIGASDVATGQGNIATRARGNNIAWELCNSIGIKVPITTTRSDLRGARGSNTHSNSAL